MWRGGQDQKIRQANLMSNTKDENEPTDAEAVTLSRLMQFSFAGESRCPEGDQELGLRLGIVPRSESCPSPYTKLSIQNP